MLAIHERRHSDIRLAQNRCTTAVRPPAKRLQLQRPSTSLVRTLREVRGWFEDSPSTNVTPFGRSDSPNLPDRLLCHETRRVSVTALDRPGLTSPRAAAGLVHPERCSTLCCPYSPLREKP